MTRRGFTLLELLIAIALLLALAALSVPAIMSQLDDRRFESAVELTTSQLLLARSHAQSTGQTIEVLYRSSPARLEARIFRPGEMGKGDISTEFEADDLAAVGEGEEASGFQSLAWDEEAEPNGLIFEGWALLALPEGIQISDSPPDSADDLLISTADFEGESWGEGFSPPVAPSDWEQDEPVTIRLAVFLPDGSALICEPAWLWDGGRRQGRLSINPWSGLPDFEILDRPSDEALESEGLADEEYSPPGDRSSSDEPYGMDE